MLPTRLDMLMMLPFGLAQVRKSELAGGKEADQVQIEQIAKFLD